MTSIDKRIEKIEARISSLIDEFAGLKNLTGEELFWQKLALNRKLCGSEITVKDLHELLAEDDEFEATSSLKRESNVESIKQQMK